MDMFPFFIFQRVALIPNARGVFLYPIETGYWYWLRKILCKWAEVDAAGAVFIPDMLIEISGSSRHRSYQDNPVSLRLLSSPCGNGVNINVAGQMTATGPSSAIAIDELLPQRDNIVMHFSGNNATPFPAFINVCLVGYMIPDNKMIQFRGTNG
jgi:hypothetical protein